MIRVCHKKPLLQKMAFPQTLCFLQAALFFVMIVAFLSSFVSCDHDLSNLQEVVPLNHDHLLVEDQTAENGYNYGDDLYFPFQAYPSSYMNMFEDGKFEGLIQEKTDVLMPEEKVGMTSISTSVYQKVNVNKYGAKGDGSHDDTEVIFFFFFFRFTNIGSFNSYRLTNNIFSKFDDDSVTKQPYKLKA